MVATIVPASPMARPRARFACGLASAGLVAAALGSKSSGILRPLGLIGISDDAPVRLIRRDRASLM
jgi:hypothetical protein